MLLPSALPSEPFLPPLQPARPPFISPGPFQPSMSVTTTMTTSYSLLATCRALQGILGSAPTLSCQSTRPSPTPPRRTETRRDALVPCDDNAKVRKSSAPKRSVAQGKKRRREEYEDEDDVKMIHGPSLDQENSNISFNTPKRQRRPPLDMPLGLSAADFHSLESPQTEDIELDMPDHPTFEVASDTETLVDSDWTPADDRALVESVLDKLRLSKNQWNDCARKLGKDKDSLGRRWKMLVGDGEVGLRRGGKRSGRTDLDISSW